MITPMLRPDLFGALASHAGDTLYEYCYLRDFGEAVRKLRPYDGEVSRWWDDFRSRTSFTKDGDDLLLGLYGAAACFSSLGDGTPELPFDSRTGVLGEQVWQRWLDWDPVRMVPGHVVTIRSLHSIWVEAGTRDDYFLDVGAEAFVAALHSSGVGDDVVRFELFDATHAAIEYRYPMSLTWLCQRMSAKSP
jgi:hypothetical protein